MIKPRRTSVVILITLAELAWLAAFGLLFAYRGKVGELGKIKHELHSATNDLAVYRANSPGLIGLVEQLKNANTNQQLLKDRLEVFEKYLKGIPPEEAAKRLAAGEDALKQIKDLTIRVNQQDLALAEAAAKLAEARAAFSAILNDKNELLAKVETLQQQLQAAQTGATNIATALKTAEDNLNNWVAGEFAVRRELTGLPDGKLRRVIFLVDTSTSMRNSPSWESAKTFIRMWLRFLPVEECALVNFNDKATGFPERDYQRVRETTGQELPEQREAFIHAFDLAHAGTFTDLMRGLQRAYEYPAADVMVLFTDGHPHVDYQSDSSLAKDIFKEAEKHHGIPILTVALGSYEIENAGGFRPQTNAAISFLKELSHKTGGNFLAR